MAVLEIVVDGPRNESHFFKPLNRVVRGRFEWDRVANPLAKLTAINWPGDPPGQHIGVDTVSRKAWVYDPLHAPEHKKLREKIIKDGFALAPERDEIEGVDVPTWLYHMKRAVEGGHAKVVKGKLPTKIDGEPKKRFFTRIEVDERDETIAGLVKEVAELRGMVRGLSAK